MKQVKHSFNLLLLVLISSLTMWSCSYTNKTSGSKQFAKKHYNRGLVKIKNNKKATPDTEALAMENAEPTRKEKKAALKEEVKSFLDGKDLTASSEGNEATYTAEALSELATEKLAAKKNELLAEKEAATSERAEKKADKKLGKLEKLEAANVSMAEKIANNYTPPGPEASAPAGGTPILGILALVFGFLSLVFIWIPYIWILGMLLALAAIVLGAIAMSRGDQLGGILGGVGMGLGILAMLLFLVALIAFATFVI